MINRSAEDSAFGSLLRADPTDLHIVPIRPWESPDRIFRTEFYGGSSETEDADA